MNGNLEIIQGHQVCELPLTVFWQFSSSLMLTLYSRYSLVLRFRCICRLSCKACVVVFMFAFLTVGPFNFHLRIPMVPSTGCCLALLRKSTFLMVCGRLIPMMFFRQTWTDLMDVDVSVCFSDPYRSTEFTLVLNIRARCMFF